MKYIWLYLWREEHWNSYCDSIPDREDNWNYTVIAYPGCRFAQKHSKCVATRRIQRTGWIWGYKLHIFQTDQKSSRCVANTFKVLNKYEDTKSKYFKVIKKDRGVLQPDAFKQLDENEETISKYFKLIIKTSLSLSPYKIYNK